MLQFSNAKHTSIRKYFLKDNNLSKSHIFGERRLGGKTKLVTNVLVTGADKTVDDVASGGAVEVNCKADIEATAVRKIDDPSKAG